MAVGPLPISPVVPPADIAAQYKAGVSGQLDPKLLVVIGPSGKLHHDAARAYRALAFMCLSIGLPLTYTYGGTYRPYADQVTLFHQRYETPPVAGRATKTWNGVKYSIRYVNGRPVAMAGVPGTSNHGWGLAVDFAFDSNPSDGIGPDDAASITSHPQWPTFKQYAVGCGFSWESTSEPWHLRLVTGSRPTQFVLDIEAIMYPNPVEEEMAKAIQVPGDPAVFAATSALTVYWMRAGVDVSLANLGLVETNNGAAFQVSRAALKGLDYRGVLPNAGPTVATDFNVFNGVPQP